MTVIVWDGRTLASDSWSTTEDGRIGGSVVKIGRNGNLLFGAAGITTQCFEAMDTMMKYKDSMSGHADFPSSFMEIDGDSASSMMLIIRKGKMPPGGDGVHQVYLYSAGAMAKISPMYGKYAIGLCDDMAIGAMMAGADSRRAVEICSQMYGSIGGEIQTVSFDD